MSMEWMPVSEKNPRLGELVLVWEQDDYSFARYKITRSGAYFTICESDGYEWDLKAEEVDAWCELPEPYRGERKEAR